MTNPHESGRTGKVGAAVLLIAAAFLTGCPDPQAEFDDFEARDIETRPPPIVAACGETTDEVEGDFFFALSAKLSPTKPIVFSATITTQPEGLLFEVTALAAADRKTPVGSPVSLGPYPVDADGKIEAVLPELTIPGEANPISGSEIVAQTTLSGAVCEDLICGDVSGQVTKPAMLPLAGSTFTMSRVEGGVFPEPPPINCDGDLAAEL